MSHDYVIYSFSSVHQTYENMFMSRELSQQQYNCQT